MINSLEVGCEALLKFFLLVSCILDKKRPEDLNTSYLGEINSSGGRALNKICLYMTRYVMTYMKEIRKWTNILTNKLVFYFFNFF